MSLKPSIHLVLPYLLQPISEWDKNYKISPSYDYLTRFFVNFQISKNSKTEGVYESVFAHLGLNDNLELPIAVYRRQTHANEQQSQSSSLVCADPVHLEVGLNDITLTDQVYDLTDSESKELISLLNDHFNHDGLKFIYGCNHQWYLELEDSGFTSTSLGSVLGDNITGYLPKSKQRNWDSINNETQMILHSAEVNRDRERIGVPTVNSLWFWGGGRSLETENKISHIISDNEQRGKVIANATHSEWLSFDGRKNLKEYLQKDTIIIFEALKEPAKNNDFELYQQQLSQLEHEVIKPIYEAWKQNKIELTIDSCTGAIYQPVKQPSWKFWNAVPPNLLGICK